MAAPKTSRKHVKQRRPRPERAIAKAWVGALEGLFVTVEEVARITREPVLLVGVKNARKAMRGLLKSAFADYDLMVPKEVPAGFTEGLVAFQRAGDTLRRVPAVKAAR